MLLQLNLKGKQQKPTYLTTDQTHGEQLENVSLSSGPDKTEATDPAESNLSSVNCVWIKAGLLCFAGSVSSASTSREDSTSQTIAAAESAKLKYK